MVLATLLLTSMTIIVRYISEDLHPFQLAFCRNLFGLIMLAPLLLRYGLDSLKTKKIGFMAARGIFNAVAMLTYFLALGLLPLSEVSVLSFWIICFGVVALSIPRMMILARLGRRVIIFNRIIVYLIRFYLSVMDLCCVLKNEK